ncbi:MAG: hypothetical protein AAF533_15745 [Acidobacteriota bacterium]
MRTLLASLLLVSIAAPALSQEEKLYWVTERPELRRSELDGSIPEVLIPSLRFLNGIAVDPDAGHLYWIDSSGVRRSQLDGSGVEDLVETNQNVGGMDIDVASGKVYWTETGPGIVRRASLDGSGAETLLSGLNFPTDVSLDLDAGKLYWCELSGNVLGRANLDGSMSEVLPVAGVSAPQSLAVDGVNDKLYFVEDIPQRLRRVTFDGTALETLVSGGASVEDVALDVPNGHLYWTADDAVHRGALDASGAVNLLTVFRARRLALIPTDGHLYVGGMREIQRADLDGANATTLLTTLLEDATGLAVDGPGGRAYWLDGENRMVQRSRLDGTDLTDLVASGRSPQLIALDRQGRKMYWTSHDDRAGGFAPEQSGRDDAGERLGRDVVAERSGGDRTLGGEVFVGLLHRADLDGSNAEVLYETGFDDRLWGVAVDEEGAKLYFASDDALLSADLDGSNVATVLATVSPRGVALDPIADRLYWTNDGDEIRSVGLDGSGEQLLPIGDLDEPWDIAVDAEEGKLYWSSRSVPRIRRANLDGSAVETVATGHASASGVAVVRIPATVPLPPWAVTALAVTVALVGMALLRRGATA